MKYKKVGYFLLIFFSLILISGLVSAGVTYNAGTDTILVVGDATCGDAVGNECDFNDIYNADVAGGWGQFSKQGNNQFLFDAHLDIGDGTTTTYFADTSKMVTYSGVSTFIKIMSNGHFRIGEVYDASNKLSRYGCTITSTGVLQNIIHLDGTGVLEIYSSIIDSPGGQLYTKDIGSQMNSIWNTIWRGHSPSATNGIANIDIYNVRIEDATSGILSVGPQDKITISSGTTYGGFLASMPDKSGVSGYNIYGTSFEFLVLWCPGVTIYFDNVQSYRDSWSIMLSGSSGVRLERRYSFELQVVDADGDAISGASIQIKDKNDALVVNETTSDDGYLNTDYGNASSGTPTTLVDSSKSWAIDEHKKSFVRISSGTGVGQERYITSNDATTLTLSVSWTTNPDSTSKYYIFPNYLLHGYFTTGTETVTTPHTIEITKTNYTDYETKFNISSKIDWTIALDNGTGGNGTGGNGSGYSGYIVGYNRMSTPAFETTCFLFACIISGFLILRRKRNTNS